MRCSTFILLLLTVVKLFVETQSQGFPHFTHIKGVRCNVSDEYFYKNFSCFAKAYSRTLTTVNVFTYLKKISEVINVDVSLLYKYGTIYREVMHTPRIDWCQTMKVATSNLMVKQLIQLIRDNAPEIVHECPYTDFILRNMTGKLGTVQSLVPQGDYKIIFNIFDKSGTNIFAINVIFSVTSPLKESFG